MKLESCQQKAMEFHFRLDIYLNIFKHLHYYLLGHLKGSFGGSARVSCIPNLETFNLFRFQFTNSLIISFELLI